MPVYLPGNGILDFDIIRNAWSGDYGRDWYGGVTIRFVTPGRISIDFPDKRPPLARNYAEMLRR